MTTARATSPPTSPTSCMLGHGSAGLREFDRQVKRGVLGSPKHAKRFRRRMLATLHRFGYR